MLEYYARLRRYTETLICDATLKRAKHCSTYTQIKSSQERNSHQLSICQMQFEYCIRRLKEGGDDDEEKEEVGIYRQVF